MAQCWCSTCGISFTSVGAFDKHLGTLMQGEGYEHKAPADCGLVIRKDGKVSFPAPDAKAFWRRYPRGKD